MGFLSEYANKSGLQKHQTGPKVTPGGSYGNPSLSSRASITRLVEAFRSQSPGGWSDDRWEQSKHLVGITYVCAHRICEQMSQAEFQVFIRDPSHPQGKREVTEKDKPQTKKLHDLGIKPWDLVELLERPNDEDSFGDMMYKWGQQLLLTGMGLTWMLPNELGIPMQLFSVPTAIAIPQPTINPEFPHGFYRIQPVYPYGPFSSYPTPASAVGAPIPAHWLKCQKPFASIIS